MNRKYNCDWHNNHNKFERFLEKVESFLLAVYNATINKILDKLPEQKIKIRIDDYDIWSMDDTLAHIISPMLKKLKEHKHGSAYVDNEDVPPDLRHPVTDDPDHDPLVDKRWAYVLDEMIWAFDRKVENDYLYDDSYKDLQKRMTNGFRLFGKYYESLWD
jgi:hypothetical protein